MTKVQRRYVTVETLISVVINAVISVAFVWFAFGGMSAVTTGAIILDAVPQSFMVTLMCVVVPGLLTSRRIAAGSIAPIKGMTARWPLAVRAIAAALVAALFGLALHVAVLAAWSLKSFDFNTVLVIKSLYGATLAAIVTPFSLRHALKIGSTVSKRA